MSTAGIGRWRERKGGQFASRQHLSNQRRAMLAPVQKWRREWTVSTSAPSSSVKILRWVRTETSSEEVEEEAIMAAALDRAGGRDSAQLAGLSGLGDESTPGSMTPTAAAGTPAASGTPGPPITKGRTPHPLSQAVSTPNASTDVMDVDDGIDAAQEALKQVVEAKPEIAVAALASLPDGENE